MLGTECQGKSCCENILVPGGAFPLGRSDSGTDQHDGHEGEQPEHAVTVSDFYLDTYEVTVGRFRKFVEQYDGTAPSEGAGAHPLIVGSGWQAAWASELPATQAGLMSNLKCFTFSQTWTDTAGGNETHAISCVTWYESFAFCAWDGGRLPTEAEWEYASAGATENRLYPWGQAAPSATYANYNDSDNSPNEVGSHAAGAGRWGHQDLAGSMFEWVFDCYDSGWYAGGGSVCNDCANMSAASLRALRGGGFGSFATDLRAAYRYADMPSDRFEGFGFRCARTP
jgi:formylglycine-generating enzyme required for sulfatase activity